MFAHLFAIVMMVAAMVGGGGAAAVYAAQDSLPGETLYPLKTLSEEVRMDLSRSEETKLELNLQYAERRMTELAEVAGEDNDLAARTMLRLQEHLNQALAATGKVTQEQALPAMERVRQTLQNQQRLMEQLFVNSDPVHEQAMEHNRQMLTEQLRVVENDLLEEQLQLQNKQMNGQQGEAGQGQQQSGQQGQGLQQGLNQVQDPSLLDNQTQNEVQNQINQPDTGQPMNQNRFRITLTPGLTPDAEQFQQGKGNGMGPAVMGTPQP